MKGDNYYKIGARSLITGGNIHTSKTGRLAWTPGFLRPGIQAVNTFKGGSDHRRNPPTDDRRFILEILFLASCMGLLTGFIIGGADLVVSVVNYIKEVF